MRTGLTAVPGAELVEVQRAQRESYRVRATVRTPIVIDPNRVALLQRAAADATHAPVELVVRSVLTREADARAYLW